MAVRILIVEDDFLLATAVEGFLASAGHEIVGLAPDHATAVAAARRHRPDLVLMDVQLARGSSGIAAALEIYEETGVRSLFLTATADEALRRRARAARPLGWLAKPYDAAALLAAVAARETA